MLVLSVNLSSHILSSLMKVRLRLGGDCTSVFCHSCALVLVFAPWPYVSWCGVTFIAGCPLGFVVYFFVMASSLLPPLFLFPSLYGSGAGAPFEQIWSEGKGVAALDYWCACRRKFSSDARWRKSACLWPLWGLPLTGLKGGWTCVSVFFSDLREV